MKTDYKLNGIEGELLCKALIALGAVLCLSSCNDRIEPAKIGDEITQTAVCDDLYILASNDDMSFLLTTYIPDVVRYALTTGESQVTKENDLKVDTDVEMDLLIGSDFSFIGCVDAYSDEPVIDAEYTAVSGSITTVLAPEYDEIRDGGDCDSRQEIPIKATVDFQSVKMKKKSGDNTYSDFTLNDFTMQRRFLHCLPGMAD